MNAWLLLLIIPLFLLLAAKVLAQAGGPKTAAQSPPAPPAGFTAQQTSGLSKEKLREMLQQVEKAPVPANRPPEVIAMCYAIAPPPDRSEYVCPTCFEKTIYKADTRQADITTVAWGIAAARRSMQQLRSHTKDIKLEESEFCRKCSPSQKIPALILKVTFSDGTVRTTRNVSSSDIDSLVSFFAAQKEIGNPKWDPTPMQNCLPRVKEILGEGFLKGTSGANEPKPLQDGKAAPGYHLVAAGDTLIRIARQYNLTVKELQSLNPGVKADRLQVGSKILVHPVKAE